MSIEVTWKCDGCGKKAQSENPYIAPTGWTAHCMQSEAGKGHHGCSAACLAKVLRADAAAYERADIEATLSKEDHDRKQEAARLAGLELQANAERTKKELEQRRADALRAEQERRAASGKE